MQLTCCGKDGIGIGSKACGNQHWMNGQGEHDICCSKGNDENITGGYFPTTNIYEIEFDNKK